MEKIEHSLYNKLPVTLQLAQPIKRSKLHFMLVLDENPLQAGDDKIFSLTIQNPEISEFYTCLLHEIPGNSLFKTGLLPNTLPAGSYTMVLGMPTSFLLDTVAVIRGDRKATSKTDFLLPGEERELSIEREYDFLVFIISCHMGK